MVIVVTKLKLFIIVQHTRLCESHIIRLVRPKALTVFTNCDNEIISCYLYMWKRIRSPLCNVYNSSIVVVINKLFAKTKLLTLL
jgi:hypothetical protein